MIRIKLLENRDGSLIAEVFSPYVPIGMSLQLNLSGDVVRDYYVEGVYESVFHQDGLNGPITLTSVTLCVTETLESRIRSGQLGRTEA